MKTFTRIKVINNREYLYEITPYYDPETKKIRHKSRYLGKNKEGRPVRVRSHIPVRAFSYGEFIPFLSVIQELKIKEILSEYLNLEEITSLIAVVLNRVVHPLSLQHIGSWFEGTCLYVDNPDIALSSQSLSRLLEKIGNSSLPMILTEGVIRQLKTEKVFFYDVTSISSYSKGIGILEYGYNRDNDGLAQVNVSLIVDRQMGIPVMYEIYPGSIVDVSTLLNTVKKLRGYGVKDCLMVLDRGFFSTANLLELEESGMFYIIPASISMKVIKTAMNKAQKKLLDPNSMRMYKGEAMFVSEIEVKIAERLIKGYCYYSPSRQNRESEIFHKRLYEIKEAIQRHGECRRIGMDTIEEIAGRYKRYFKITRLNKGIEIKIRKNAVTQHINRLGRFIILYKGDIGWEECLRTYRGKDIVEKGFDILKNDLDGYTPNMRKESTLRGLLFMLFIGLMIRMRLMKKMEDAGLNKKYSIDGLITELSKLKMIELSNGHKLKTELTKKQKQILSLLDLCA